MFRTLLKKELFEQLRTHRALITVAVFFVAGLISPLLAKYTPLLLEMVPDIPPDFANLIPEPTIKDAVGQYVKNVSQFGVILVIVLTMGAVAGEKERGTAAMLLTKPVTPGMVVLTKWLAGMANILLGLILAATGCALYTALLFEPLDVQGFLALNVFLLVFLGVYLSITLLASALARTQAMAAGLAFAGLGLLLMLGAIPRVQDVMPGKLLDWGSALVSGTEAGAWWALIVAINIMLACIVLAAVSFNREEI